MAIHIDPRPFSGGAVVFNSQPSVNFYAQLLAKKQAKEEAIANYVRDLNTKVTPAGVRTADLPAWNKKYQEWFDYGKGNMNTITKDPVARANYSAWGQNLMNMAQQSKAAELHNKPANDMLFDPKKASQVSDDFMQGLHQSNLPIWDEDGNPNPNYKPLDYSSKVFKPPVFDFQKTFDNSSKGVPLETTIGDVIRTDPKTGQVIRSVETAYKPEKLQAIGSQFANNVLANKDNLKYYNEKLHNLTEDEYNKYNKIYQDTFGAKQTVRPDGVILQEHLDSPEKLAAAEAIEHAKSLKKVDEKAVSDYEQRRQDKFDYAAFNSGLIVGRGGGTNLTTQQGGNAFNDFEDNDFGKLQVKDGSWYKKDGTPYSGEVFIKGQYIPSSIKSALKSGNIDPDLLIGGVNARVKDGVITSISNQIIGTVTRQTMEGVYQRKMDTERKNEPKLNFPNSNINPQPKESGMVTVVLADGRQGQIPADKVAAFLKENKGSKRK